MTTKSYIFITLISFILLAGCNNPNNIQSKNYTDISPKPLDLSSIKFTNEEKHTLQLLKEQIQLTNQIMTELDLLITEFEKQDELIEALEVMQIAKHETMVIRAKSQSDQNNRTKANSLFENLLTNYINGISAQLEGWENGDVEKMTKGYKLMQQSKVDINNLLNYINN